jgi:hypothetical protein
MSPPRHTKLLQNDVQSLHETLEVVCQKLGLPTPRPLAFSSREKHGRDPDTAAASTDNDQECEVSPPLSPSAVQAPIDTFLEVTKLGSPMSTTDTPQSFRHQRQHSPRDLVAKKIISQSVFDNLAHRYFARLDHYLYGIGSTLGDLTALQRSSPVLVAAICTVSALHDPRDQSVYELCNREFRRLASRALFEKRGLDHLQALCIGSFWLTDASRIFSSDAHRRAADARLHRSFQNLLFASESESPSSTTLSVQDLTHRVRLSYLLFICDQHLSILHNRDPLIRPDKEIFANHEAFLERDGATDSDVRLLSQVALLLIMGQVRDTFGSELDSRPAKALSTQLSNFSKQLDRWFARYSKLFKPNPYIGDFPMRGLEMHYQFSKLYLGHHVFKGLKGDVVPSYFLPSAFIARDAAVEIFDMILRDQELQQSLVGMPHYFHIMIAFAGHFLLEISTSYHEQLSIEVKQIFDLIGNVLSLFQQLACIPQHPIARMTGGLARKLRDSTFLLNRNIELGGSYNNPTASGEMIGNNGSTAPFQNLPMPPGQPTSQPAMVDPRYGHVHPNQASSNDFIFSEFEQYSFPDMSINFMA